jgi:acyl carrier protein
MYRRLFINGFKEESSVTEDMITLALDGVFNEIFDKPIALRRELTAKDVDGWDSFNHVRLIVVVEERFGISFSTTEVAELRNVGALIDLIASRLAFEGRVR